MCIRDSAYSDEIIRAKAIRDELSHNSDLEDLQDKMTLSLDDKDREIEDLKRQFEEDLEAQKAKSDGILQDRLDEFDRLSKDYEDHLASLKEDMAEREVELKDEKAQIKEQYEERLFSRDTKLQQQDQLLTEKNHEIDRLKDSEANLTTKVTIFVVLGVLIGALIGVFAFMILDYILSGSTLFGASTVIGSWVEELAQSSWTRLL